MCYHVTSMLTKIIGNIILPSFFAVSKKVKKEADTSDLQQISTWPLHPPGCACHVGQRLLWMFLPVHVTTLPKSHFLRVALLQPLFWCSQLVGPNNSSFKPRVKILKINIFLLKSFLVCLCVYIHI